MNNEETKIKINITKLKVKTHKGIFRVKKIPIIEKIYKKIQKINTKNWKNKDKKKEDGKKYYKPILFARLSIKDQVHFAKRLAFLVKSGVPILDSLFILRKQTRSRSMGKIMDVIIDDVSNGRFLSLGLSRFKDIFGEFTINVVRMGEMSGSLSQNLIYLVEELQKKHALKRKVVGAFIYPIFITVTTISISMLLTMYIFPKIMPIFTSLDVKLPITTKILIWISEFLQNYWLYSFLGLIALTITFFVLMRKISVFKYSVWRTTLKLPIAGNLFQAYNVANFCRTFSLLLKNGFNVIEALTVTADSTANPVYRKKVLEIREHMTKGGKISAEIEKSPHLFPDTVMHMITIGEASGTLSDSLMYLSEHYEAEVDDVVKNLSSLLEPILMLFMGVIVGFVAVSVITPIYEITQSLQR